LVHVNVCPALTAIAGGSKAKFFISIWTGAAATVAAVGAGEMAFHRTPAKSHTPAVATAAAPVLDAP
jgi:hypothetical protein